LGFETFFAWDSAFSEEVGIDIAGIPAEALVLSKPAPTALNRTWEKLLKDFARKARDESRAALTGAMKP